MRERGESGFNPELETTPVGWRRVEEGEVFEPGREFELNMETGETYVREESQSPDTSGDLEKPALDSPEINALDQELDPESLAEFPEVEKGVRDFLREKTENPLILREVREAADLIYERLLSDAKDVSVLYAASRTAEAGTKAKQTIDWAKEIILGKLGKYAEDWFKEYDEIKKDSEEAKGESKNRLTKLALDGADFIPVLGSAKMIGEAMYGRTMGGEELKGYRRALHLAEGTAFLALDLTGLGVFAKGGVKASKLLTRSSALMRKVGFKPTVYKSVFRTGRFLAKNPMLAKGADKLLEYAISQRKKRKITWAKRVPEVVLEMEEQQAA